MVEQIAILLFLILLSLGVFKVLHDFALGESANPSQLRLAVLGDSDSHSYGDTLWFPPESSKRGGRYRDQTLQWTEVLARLRGNEIDLGAWGTWGVQPSAAKVVSTAGMLPRTPRKQDYEYNFAWSGAKCANLNEGTTGQVQHFVHRVEHASEIWMDGIVVIRIGINDLGVRKFMDMAAAEGPDDRVADEVLRCLGHIEEAVRILREQTPGLKIVLVGILNNSDWPPYLQYWQSEHEQRNINAVLDIYDDGLRDLAEADANIAFFDDRAWFRTHWGGRSPDGRPDYRTVELSDKFVISNTQGDSPEHAVVADGHGGTLLNAIWVQDFIRFLNRTWGQQLTPVATEEIENLARSLSR